LSRKMNSRRTDFIGIFYASIDLEVLSPEPWALGSLNLELFYYAPDEEVRRKIA
jgi:hypothetical protein